MSIKDLLAVLKIKGKKVPDITKEQFVNAAGRFYRIMVEQEGQIKQLKKTIESLVEEKHTLYGDGYGFLAVDNSGQTVWVNSTSIALEQKDEEIKELKPCLAKETSNEQAV